MRDVLMGGFATFVLHAAPDVEASGGGIAGNLLAVFVLRALQAVVLAAPTFLAGLLVAGAIRGLVGAERLRAAVGRGGAGDVLRAWGLSLLVPVCSFGVLPVLAELHRAGTRKAVLLTVALTAGAFNPWTLMYGLERLGWLRLGVLLAASLAVSMAAGLLWERLSQGGRAHANAATGDAVAGEGQGLVAALRAAASALSVPVAADVAVGLLGVGLLAMWLPAGTVGHMLLERDWDHALYLFAIPLPAFVTPEMVMMQADQAFAAGAIFGIVLPLLVFGAAVNLGLFSFLCRTSGARSAASCAVLVIAVMAAASYGVDTALYRGESPQEDTHAFDGFGRPYGPVHDIGRAVGKTLGASHVAALVGIGLLGVVGRIPRRHPSANAAAVPPSRGVLHKPIPRPALIALGIAGLLASGVGAAYAYYPAPDVLVEEMFQVDAALGTAVRRNEQQAALESLDRMESLAAKLARSAFLRQGPRGAEVARRDAELRHTLAEMRRELLASAPAPAEWDLAARCHKAMVAYSQSYDVVPWLTRNAEPQATPATGDRGGSR